MCCILYMYCFFYTLQVGFRASLQERALGRKEYQLQTRPFFMADWIVYWTQKHVLKRTHEWTWTLAFVCSFFFPFFPSVGLRCGAILVTLPYIHSLHRRRHHRHSQYTRDRPGLCLNSSNKGDRLHILKLVYICIKLQFWDTYTLI